jgi:hypothetical protein
MSEGWYTRGASQEDIDKARKESSSGSARRFWLKAKEAKRVIFLDDEPFCVWEHNPVINGEFWHWFTCRKGIDPSDPMCPLCVSKVKRQYTGYLTVLDATGWQDRKGNLVLYNRKLFPMTLKTLELFNAIKKKKTTLVGAQFELMRTSKDAVKVGDHWDFEEFVKPFDDEKYFFESKLEGKKKPPEPFDYVKLMEPLSSAEMQGLGVGGSSDYGSGGDDNSGTEGGGDDDELY